MIDPIVRDRNISDLSFEDLTLIISAALSRDYPDEKVDDIEAVPVEIGNAISTILILGCFVQVAPGEAKAAEAAA